MRDVIVVGAGPVGSEIARGFAEKEMDVLVIERSEEIGEPLACSGHVSPEIWNFTSAGTDELEQNSIKGAIFHNGGREHKFYRDETVSHVIDRVKLDRIKAEEAGEAGAEYTLGEEVESIREKTGGVNVITDEGRYEASIVAGCDGANSTVRQTLGLECPDRFYQGLIGFSDERDEGDFVDVYMNVPGYFGWRIPRGTSVEYGVAVPPGISPKKWLEKISGEEVLENYSAGTIPVGPPDKTISRRSFLAGDSAAHTKPFTGGGLVYGLESASIAHREINPDEPKTLNRYERAWRREIGREIFLGKAIERFYSFPGTIQNTVLRIFSGRIGVHMDRPSSIASRRQLKSLFR